MWANREQAWLAAVTKMIQLQHVEGLSNLKEMPGNSPKNCEKVTFF